MKINKKKLVELLVERTGMEQAEVEDQLEQLVKRIIDAAERGKALEIKEFGLFYFDEDGELKFDPAKELSTEINFKYAGMEPVELKPPRDAGAEEGTADTLTTAPFTPASEQQDDEEEIDSALSDKKKAEAEEELAGIFGFGEDDDPEGEEDEAIDPFALDEDDDESPEPKKKETTGEDASAEKSAEPEEDAAEEEEIAPREDDPFAGLLSDASSKLTASDKGVFSDDDDEEDTIDEDLIFSEPKSEPEPKPKPKAVPAKEPAKAGTAPAGKTGTPAPKKAAPMKKVASKEPSRDPIMVVIAVVLAFVLIAAAFLVVPGMFQQGDSQPDPQQPPVTSEPAPIPGEESDAVNVLTPVEQDPETEVTEDVAEAEEIAPQADTEQPRYGLTGDLVEAANDGFSIVLHSLAREDNAREQAAGLAAEGYRVLVSPRTVQERTVWRVSVGQFATIADAQEKASELPSPYNTNNFIQRIQVN
jgi:hypothetical protein